MELTGCSGRKLACRMKPLALSPFHLFLPDPLCAFSAPLPDPYHLSPRVVPPADVEAAENDAEIVERHPKRVVPVVLHQPQARAPAACPQRRVIPPVPSPLLFWNW